MADLLGSLLPADYTAPDVQATLGGDLEGAACKGSGSNPSCTSPSDCGLLGYTPGG